MRKWASLCFSYTTDHRDDKQYNCEVRRFFRTSSCSVDIPAPFSFNLPNPSCNHKQSWYCFKWSFQSDTICGGIRSSLPMIFDESTWVRAAETYFECCKYEDLARVHHAALAQFHKVAWLTRFQERSSWSLWIILETSYWTVIASRRELDKVPWSIFLLCNRTPSRGGMYRSA